MNILSTMFNTVFNMTRLGVVLFLVIFIVGMFISTIDYTYKYI